MGNETDLLSIHGIKDCHIQEIANLQAELSYIRYWKTRQEQFAQLVPTLSAEATWLLTFSVWTTMHNPRLIPLEASRYYTLTPSKTNEVSFLDFVVLLQKYNRKQIKASNEEHVIRFLQRCDKLHFDFYLGLLSRSFTETIPTTGVHNLLDLGIIDIQEVYGYIELLHTNFSDLSYPVAIRLMDDPDYRLSVHSKEPRRTFSFHQDDDKLKQVVNFLTTDEGFINTPRYTLVGYSNVRIVQHRRKQESIAEIFPVDIFSSFLEYRRYRKNYRRQNFPTFKERMEKLKQFLSQNYTRQVQKVDIELAENEQELIQAITKLAPDKGAGYLVITDKDTARTGKAHAVPVVNTYGVIEDIWVEQGVAKGFNLWFNGKLIQCPFDFAGANNSLLNNPTLANQKMLGISNLRIGELSISLGKEIHWEKIRWKIYKHKGKIPVEKCALCGGTASPHKRQGLCKACEHNIRTYYDKYGTDVWIEQTSYMRVKRLNSGWCPDMLTNLGVFFRDSYVEARHDGSWRFRKDEYRTEQYQKYLERSTSA